MKAIKMLCENKPRSWEMIIYSRLDKINYFILTETRQEHYKNTGHHNCALLISPNSLSLGKPEKKMVQPYMYQAFAKNLASAFRKLMEIPVY